jgi:RNA polymerase sigma-70 factor (ECF subfamily)
LNQTSKLVHDRELLERAQQGDREAFEMLVRPHAEGLRRFAFSLSRTRQDADDITQEALLRAFRAIAKFDGRSSLSTWLHVVARNACADWQRSQMSRGAQHEPLVSSHPADNEANDEAAANKQQAARLWSALQQLDERSRVPLVLFELDGLSYDEIATQEGVPVGTIRSRLSRARQHLRGLLVKQEKRAGSGVYPRIRPAAGQTED